MSESDRCAPGAQRGWGHRAWWVQGCPTLPLALWSSESTALFQLERIKAVPSAMSANVCARKKNPWSGFGIWRPSLVCTFLRPRPHCSAFPEIHTCGTLFTFGFSDVGACVCTYCICTDKFQYIIIFMTNMVKNSSCDCCVKGVPRYNQSGQNYYF